MAGRYGDRFRQEPALERDLIDLGEIGLAGAAPDRGDEIDLDPEPSGGWHRSWAARSALVAALVVGVVAGAFGWERWRVYEADVAARSAIELQASAFTLNYAAEDEVAVALTYRNDGDHDLTLRDVRFDTDRLVVLGDPEVLVVPAGKTATHVATLRAVCPEGADGIAPPAVVATVETVDGSVDEREIDSTVVGSDVVNWMESVCQMEMFEPSFDQTYPDFQSVTTSEDGTAVRAVMGFGLDDGTRVQIDSVTASSDAFVVDVIVGDLTSSTSFQAPPITVVYRVGECDAARTASEDDMVVSIVGSIEGTEPAELRAYPTAPLAIALARLAAAGCAT